MTDPEMRRWAIEQAVKVARAPHEVLLLAEQIRQWALVGAAPTVEVKGIRKVVKLASGAET